MAVRTVGADADEVRPVSPDGFISVTEALRLTVSAGGEVLQVEIEDRGPAASPFHKPEPFAVMTQGLEVGGYGPGLQHSVAPS